MAKYKVDYYEAEELAASILGMEEQYKEDQDSGDQVEDMLARRHDISMSTFHEIVNEVMNRVEVGISPITNTVFLGLVNKERNQFFTKEEFTSTFINLILQWMMEDEKPEPGKKFAKEITNEKGEVQYILTLQRSAPPTEEEKTSE